MNVLWKQNLRRKPTVADTADILFQFFLGIKLPIMLQSSRQKNVKFYGFSKIGFYFFIYFLFFFFWIKVHYELFLWLFLAECWWLNAERKIWFSSIIFNGVYVNFSAQQKNWQLIWDRISASCVNKKKKIMGVLVYIAEI